MMDATLPPRRQARSHQLAALTTVLATLLRVRRSPGPIRQAFRDCTPCGRSTAAALNQDGWLCGECLTPHRAGGARRG